MTRGGIKSCTMMPRIARTACIILLLSLALLNIGNSAKAKPDAAATDETSDSSKPSKTSKIPWVFCIKGKTTKPKSPLPTVCYLKIQSQGDNADKPWEKRRCSGHLVAVSFTERPDLEPRPMILTSAHCFDSKQHSPTSSKSSAPKASKSVSTGPDDSVAGGEQQRRRRKRSFLPKWLSSSKKTDAAKSAKDDAASKTATDDSATAAKKDDGIVSKLTGLLPFMGKKKKTPADATDGGDGSTKPPAEGTAEAGTGSKSVMGTLTGMVSAAVGTATSLASGGKDMVMQYVKGSSDAPPAPTDLPEASTFAKLFTGNIDVQCGVKEETNSKQVRFVSTKEKPTVYIHPEYAAKQTFDTRDMALIPIGTACTKTMSSSKISWQYQSMLPPPMPAPGTACVLQQWRQGRQTAKGIIVPDGPGSFDATIVKPDVCKSAVGTSESVCSEVKKAGDKDAPESKDVKCDSGHMDCGPSLSPLLVCQNGKSWVPIGIGRTYAKDKTHQAHASFFYSFQFVDSVFTNSTKDGDCQYFPNDNYWTESLASLN